LTFTKLDGVFRSGNNTRDDAPSHLLVRENLPLEVQRLYVELCPAGVYEQQDGKLVVSSSNCVDCKAADVLGPRWRPREGGAGTKYKRM
jgi:electron-transferring-flavoprotein dehydrogenase